MLYNTLALLSLIVIILLLRSLVNMFPSLIACLLRWKESINLQMSVKLGRERDTLALAMVIPFCLTAYRFELYRPAFFNSISENAKIWIILGAFAAFVIIRKSCSALLRPKRIPVMTYKSAIASERTFFIILTLVLLAIGGCLSLFDVSTTAIRDTMFWVSGTIYVLFLLRKLQIFNSSCSIFLSFLYLCALEILPIGVLVTSTVIF